MEKSDLHNTGLWTEFDAMLVMPPKLTQSDALNESGIQGFYAVSPVFSGFSGHFPDYPVLPALMQILMLRHLAEKALHTRLTCREIKNAKFMSQGKPDDLLLIDMTLKNNEQQDAGVNLIKVNATLKRCPDYSSINATQLNMPLDTLPWEELSRQRLTFVVAENMF